MFEELFGLYSVGKIHAPVDKVLPTLVFAGSVALYWQPPVVENFRRPLLKGFPPWGLLDLGPSRP
jgi:hypothetical protein